MWQKFVSLILGMLCLTACSPSPIKLALSLPDLNNPYFQTMANSAKEYCQSRGYQLVLIYNDGNSNSEFEQAVAAQQQGAQVLIIVPSKASGSVKTIQYANQANWPVISLDRNVNGGKVTQHISSDNYMGGKMAAEFLLAMTKQQGSLLELTGPSDISVTQDRSQGFADVLQAYQLPTSIKANAGFSQLQAQILTSEMLAQHRHISGIFAHNDEMALGAAAALPTPRSIAIIGFDGTQVGLSSIEQNIYDATLVQQPEVMITTAINSAVNIINGARPVAYLKIPLRLQTNLHH
ncbi:substrate-binding domain-containing protein [Motilimonas cestriensis]|uniref:Substrate-binding domain-containing protein n=1 Tax=Motilimonas cestriensis TaxID=2742685 RepID=A0ABS8W8E5_9GAMM|nr:substrate-binding domain-containing protein [Motilimonas cestriensis]MCE2594018.1 substrate-binding domain-containing protein [Motilimonas cestriensis]